MTEYFVDIIAYEDDMTSMPGAAREPSLGKEPR